MHWIRLALKNKTTKALLTRSHGPKDLERNTNYLADPNHGELSAAKHAAGSRRQKTLQLETK